VLAVFGASSTSTWANIAIGTAVSVIMLVIAIAGIKITARTQVGMAFIEYTLLIGFCVAGLIAVLAHHPRTGAIWRPHGEPPYPPRSRRLTPSPN
jgi:amino acid transporter